MLRTEIPRRCRIHPNYVEFWDRHLENGDREQFHSANLLSLRFSFYTVRDQTRMEDSFREAVRANPDNVEGQNGVAKVRLETGRFDDLT